MTWLGTLGVGLAFLSPPAANQDSVSREPRCVAGQTSPRCGIEFLTNYGVYGMVRSGGEGGSHLRVAADWGPLVSVGPNAAIGGTFFASLDADGLRGGPALRYRRRLADPRAGSVEVSLGVPVWSTRDDLLSSPYGMIKWSPAGGYGFVLRPELRRRRDYDCGSPPATCVPVTRANFALSAGIEVGGIPGMIATGATVVGLLALLVAYVNGVD